ncbi:MAG: phenylacetate--CoA ligase family protein [Gammaproteobacteria bacterium]
MSWTSPEGEPRASSAVDCARLVSGQPAVTWPVIPTPAAAGMLGLIYQLEASQWWDAERLERHQYMQLARLLTHARRTAPFYEAHLAGLPAAGALTPAWFATLPTLSRRAVQAEADALRCRVVPQGHGEGTEYASSGSTGRPVRVLGTRLHALFWRALLLRDHLWHQRDLGGKLAVLRTRIADRETPNWGAGTAGVFATGPCVSYNSVHDVAEQARWLCAEDPDYLIGHPSNLRAVLLSCTEQGLRPGRLREVRCFGEMLPDDLRALCREYWGVPLIDSYSAAEVGIIALQCPRHEHFHVQAEHLLVEILDDAGRACAPGQPGRVVVTPLHNFAMPLVRYELNDQAVPGEPCPCGRGLPVIERILGRRRHMLRLPDGTTHWPSIPAKVWQPCPAIRQFQLVQTAPGAITVRLVATRHLAVAEASALFARLDERLAWRFDYRIEYHASLADGAGFTDFVSAIDEP